jgi:hypothetical protein
VSKVCKAALIGLGLLVLAGAAANAQPYPPYAGWRHAYYVRPYPYYPGPYYGVPYYGGPYYGYWAPRPRGYWGPPWWGPEGKYNGGP